MAYLLGLTAATIISFSAILVRLADVSASTAAFLRPAYALPVILLLYLLTRRSDTRSRRLRLATVVAGGLMGLSFTLWNHSIQFIGAGLATLMGNTQVLFVGVLAWLLMGERPPRAAWLAVPLVFAGVVLTTGVGREGTYGEQPLLGVLYGIANAVSYACFLLVFRRASRGLRRPSGPLLDATLGAALAALVLGVTTDPSFDLMPTWPAHGWLVVLALLPQTLGWWLILTVLPRLPALETSVMLLLQPVLTVVWGWTLFAEHLSALQWAGVVLVLAGIAQMSVRGAVRRPTTSSPGPLVG
jgi:drug/metabolite transporter (DMT)-like permease